MESKVDPYGSCIQILHRKTNETIQFIYQAEINALLFTLANTPEEFLLYDKSTSGFHTFLFCHIVL